MTSIPSDYDFLIEFMAFIRVSTQTEGGDANILAIKGASPATPTGTNLYSEIHDGGLVQNDDAPDKNNDAIILVRKDDRSNKFSDILVGTVDPGLYYTSKDPHPLGASHLTFGQHQYVCGLHRGQEALRPLDEVNRVWRDKNGNFKPDAGEMVYTGAFGVNIHAGGKGESIGRYSAGCINIAGGYSSKPYQHFLEVRDLHFKHRTNRKGSIGVTVWRMSDLIGFATNGWHHIPTLVMGMKNGWVADMQLMLKHHKFYSGAIDGDWRTGTTTGVVSFQKANGLTPDGWCGPKTWAALMT